MHCLFYDYEWSWRRWWRGMAKVEESSRWRCSWSEPRVKLFVKLVMHLVYPRVFSFIVFIVFPTFSYVVSCHVRGIIYVMVVLICILFI
jgi:hypothetical protein